MVHNHLGFVFVRTQRFHSTERLKNTAEMLRKFRKTKWGMVRVEETVFIAQMLELPNGKYGNSPGIF